MNNRREQEELLKDVLAEASPPDFREASLQSTLRLARGRRRWRQGRRGAAAVAVLMLAGWCVWHREPGGKGVGQSVDESARSAYAVVETQPLAVSAMVRSGRLAGLSIVSSESTVKEVATISGAFHLIDDDQLLALANRPAILVRTGPNSEELFFADRTQ